MSKVRRSTGVPLMMALVLSLGAQCLVGQDMTTAQMACCAATDHDCGAAAATEDCCQSERAEQDQLLTQAQHLVPPVALIASTIPALVPPLNTYASAFDVNTTELRAASPPKYVLLASFLI
ncbi:MAG: hypothetical protein HY657_05525 [Acidobacteria bacterium]|nr:hypothetical protein [Acidobacteriota bacterium]